MAKARTKTMRIFGIEIQVKKDSDIIRVWDKDSKELFSGSYQDFQRWLKKFKIGNAPVITHQEYKEAVAKPKASRSSSKRFRLIKNR